MNKKTVAISAAIVGAAVILFFGLKTMKGAALSETNEFPADKYVVAPKSFAGNTYAVNVQIDSQLAYDDISGRMLLVRTGDSTPLPVFVPVSISEFNPMVGQKYKFSVKISGDGMLTLIGFKKI